MARPSKECRSEATSITRKPPPPLHRRLRYISQQYTANISTDPTEIVAETRREPNGVVGFLLPHAYPFQATRFLSIPNAWPS